MLVGADLVRAAALGGAAAVALTHGPLALVFAAAVIIQIATTAFRPSQAALIPSLAERPEQLAAANAISSALEATGFFLGPALAGLLLVLARPGIVLAVTAAAFLWSALLIFGIRRPAAPAGEQESRPRLIRQLLAGADAIVRVRTLRLLMGLFAAQTLVYGLLNVLIVVSALDLLHSGSSGVGYLNSALGLGALLGAFGVLALLMRERLATSFGLGIALWGLPLALFGAWPNRYAALLLFACVGIGNSVADVSILTLLQRAVAEDVLARVFGVLESLALGSIAIGAIVAPALIDAIGIRWSLAAAGLLLPALALLAAPRLRTIDAKAGEPSEELTLLRSVPILAPLPPLALEELAGHVERVDLPAGAAVFHQGEPGDRFYVVGAGELELKVDGQPARTLAAGDFFGEIALLRAGPRTGTIVVIKPAILYALDGDDFVAAVTGHPPTREAADAAIATRLAALRPGLT